MIGKFERKILYVGVLLIFLIGNIIFVFSVNYGMLMFLRVICVVSGLLIIVLLVIFVFSVVELYFCVCVIGIIFMGISGLFVFGVLFGFVFGNVYGWCVLFVLIFVLIVMVIVCILLFLMKVLLILVLLIKE